MKWNRVIYIIILGFLICQCESPIKTRNDFSQINIHIKFPEEKVDALGKTVSIETITVIVQGDDMEKITENFSVTGSRVVCDLEVPRGDNRSFRIVGKDENNVVQFSGQTVADIQGSEETITIEDLTIFAPATINFIFKNITETEFDVQWSKSTADDFSHYRVLISNNPTLDLDENQIGDDVFNVNNTLMNISGAEPGTVYFVAVVVFDTEGYFAGSLTFGDDNSIVKRVLTLEPLTVPDPVEVSIDEILSDSFVLNWSRSDAEDFSFYRVLFSNNHVLDVNDNKLDNDIYDVDHTFMAVDELEPNSVYFTAVLPMNDNLDFSGSLEFGAENSVVHEVTTAGAVVLYHDDNEFESGLYLEASGERFINLFYQPAPITYIREVWFYLYDESGEQNNYRIVIINEEGDDIFYSYPLETTDGEGWIGWNVTWENFEDGFITGLFGIGIEYTKNIGWPTMGLDRSSDNGTSYYVNNEGNWYSTEDLGFSGNFGIRVIVDVAGEDEMVSGNGKSLTLTPLNSQNMKITTEKPGENIKMLSGQDEKEFFSRKVGVVKSRK